MTPWLEYVWRMPVTSARALISIVGVTQWAETMFGQIKADRNMYRTLCYDSFRSRGDSSVNVPIMEVHAPLCGAYWVCPVSTDCLSLSHGTSSQFDRLVL